MIRMCMCDKHGVVKHKYTLVCELCTAESSCTQPTDVQQLQAKIAALANEAEGSPIGSYYGMPMITLIERLRQLSAVQ